MSLTSHLGARWIASLSGLAALLAGACTSSDAPGDAAARGAGGRADTAAIVDAAYEGTETDPPSDGPPAQPGKDVWVVSCGQLLESCTAPAAAFEKAADVLGWDVTIFDGKLDPAEFSNGIRAAMAAGADGIVLGAIDCEPTSSALQEAQEAGIPTVAYYSVDCDDPSVGDQSLFTAEVNLGSGHETYPEAVREWAATKAAWVIDRLDGQGKVIDFRLSDAAVPRIIGEAFVEAMQACADCEVEVVESTAPEVIRGTFAQKVALALQQNPDARALHFSVDAVMQFANAPLRESGRMSDIQVIAGEGFEANLDLIREGGAQDAALAIPSDWTGWAAADVLNRLFAGETEMPESGIGWTLIDAEHNLPASGPYRAEHDFEAAFRRIWSDR
jgi:ribose transport system substrate-binding protein